MSRPQSRWFCKCLWHGKKRPDRAKHLLSRPLLCRPKGVSVCSVVKNTLPSGHHVDETARKPTSKPLSVPPCLRPLRVNRPEANRTPRAEGGAGTSRAKSNHREGRAPARPCPLSHVPLHLPGRITYLSSPNAMHLPLRAYCTRADLGAWRRCAIVKAHVER